MPPDDGENLRYEHRMSDADALMWNIEKDPLLRSTITAVALLDQPMDRARFLDRMERGTRLVPRMRQRVRGNMLSLTPPRWEVDPHFDLAYHVRWMRAPEPGDLRSVLDVAEPVAMQGFDRARPLWEMVVVDGLVENQSALVLKLHHAITDGVGAVKIAMALFDLEREPSDGLGPMPDAPEVDVWDARRRLVDGIDHERRRQIRLARRSIGAVTRFVTETATDPGRQVEQIRTTAESIGRMLAPATQPLSPLMTERGLSVHFETLNVPLPDAKAAARRAGGKLNDAFVAAVAGGLARYHAHHGVAVDALRMSMPINVRDDETGDLAGNQFAPARFPVPVGIADPIERMAAVRQLVVEQRAEPALALVDDLAMVLNRLPTTITTSVFGSMLRGIDFVTSNVPGVPVPIYVAGSRLLAQFPFGPMAGAATNVTLLSHIDELQIGVNTDPAAIPDPDVFLDCLETGFAEVLKAG